MSDHVITFTDTDGKLMALKPDVTLSIVKNGKDGEGLQKVFYDENVYRISGSSRSYREIMQTGLECIGEVDDYAIVEVLMLAVESLARISDDYVLDISQLDILSAVLDNIGATGALRASLLGAAGEKNLHGIAQLCREAGLEEKKAALLCALIALQGAPDSVLPQLRTLLDGSAALHAVDRLERLVSALGATGYAKNIRIDFSLVNDMSYYNGIVFKGFVKGVPAGVLSGGQYDRLMRKMGRNAGAIGFAVYLDLLERLETARDKFDVDTVLLYDEATDLAALAEAMRELGDTKGGAMAVKVIPEGLRYKKAVRLGAKGIVEV